MERINIDKIRGRYTESDGNGNCAGGDDTIDSIKLVAEKLNEIVDWINTQEKREHDRQIRMTEV